MPRPPPACSGPLYYVIVLIAITLIYWRTSPVSAAGRHLPLVAAASAAASPCICPPQPAALPASRRPAPAPHHHAPTRATPPPHHPRPLHQVGLIIASLMCGGDGLADIVGRRLGRGNPLPWNGEKSWAGSAAMFAGAARPRARGAGQAAALRLAEGCWRGAAPAILVSRAMHRFAAAAGGLCMSLGLIALFCHLGYFRTYLWPSLVLTGVCGGSEQAGAEAWRV